VAEVNFRSVFIRSGPGTQFAPVAGARLGDNYVTLARNEAGDWVEVLLESEEAEEVVTGWVFADLLDLPVEVESLPVAGDLPPTPVPQTQAPAQPAPPALNGSILYSLANIDAGRWELWVYNFATKESSKIADWRTEVATSRDHNQIAYYAWPAAVGDRAGVWIMDGDFANDRLVVRGGAYPSFSPGGDQLVVDGGDGIYVINSDGSGLRRLTAGEYPAWSPVNSTIAHRACVGGACGIYVIDATSINPASRTRLTTGGSDGQPAWSPDGSRLAYISQVDGNFEIFLMDGDGSNQTRLTNAPASDGLPAWSPNGEWIAFRSDRDGEWAIYVMREDGSDVRRITDAPVLDRWFFERLAWIP
jgi:Tol biopolymer transport system component